MRAQVAVIGLSCLLGFGDALGAPCAGFTDVQDSSSFCANVQWLKNRGITLGCTSATLYCPNDPVSRLAMAAFLNRLGNALEPEFLQQVQEGGTAVAAINAKGVVCQTQPYSPVGYPRLMTAHATLYHAAPTAELVTGRIVYSLDGGTTWLTFHILYTRATNPGGGYATQSPAPGVGPSIAPGETIIFAIQTGLFGSPTVIDAGCHLFVRVDNARSAVAPFDVPSNGERRP